jgi:exopolysaccharide biosynthesis WecB/TagA/CpsF family protein
MRTVKLLDLTFDNLDMPSVMQTLLTRPAEQKFAYVVTPNIDHLARLQRVKSLRVIYENAFLCLLDSRALRRLAGLLGLPTPDVAPGADITAQLLEGLEPQTVALIGLEPRHLPALQARYPRLTFAHHAPPMNLLDNKPAFQAACEFAAAMNARFTFIALGSPLQEYMAYSIASLPGATGIGLCVGAALEFCAGAKRRAPGWMQNAGLEWLHRLGQDPRRLARRYLLDDPPVLFALMAETFRRTGN